MAIGLGIILVLAGLVLVFDVVNVDIANVQDHTLGVILLIVGVLALVLSLVVNRQRTRPTTTVVEREVPPR
jgi:drug/metabolite transporter (DMT)-like permease